MWTLFALGILTATIRTILRFRSKGRLFLDDAFLIFACLCLAAASIILQTRLGTLISVEQLVRQYDIGDLADMPDGEALRAMINCYHSVHTVHGSLVWITIFSVKFSFLCFFRQLVEKMPRLLRYWKFVIGFNIAAFLYCESYMKAQCPHQGLAARECSLKPSNTKHPH